METHSKTTDVSLHTDWARLSFRLAEDGDAEALRALLVARPDLVDARDELGRTCLHLTMKSCSVETVRALLQAGSNVNALGWRRTTPLHFATHCISYDTLATVDLLCRSGAAIDRRDTNWMSPLMTAAQYSNLVAVSYLLGRGAKTHFRDRYGRNALDQAEYQLRRLPKSRSADWQREALHEIILALRCARECDAS